MQIIEHINVHRAGVPKNYDFWMQIIALHIELHCHIQLPIELPGTIMCNGPQIEIPMDLSDTIMFNVSHIDLPIEWQGCGTY